MPHKPVTKILANAEDQLIVDKSVKRSNEDASDSILDLKIFNQLKTLFGEKFPEVFKQRSITTNKNIDLARQAITAEGYSSLEKVMHSMKSSCRQFGACALGDIEKNIEIAANKIISLMQLNCLPNLLHSGSKWNKKLIYSLARLRSHEII